MWRRGARAAGWAWLALCPFGAARAAVPHYEVVVHGLACPFCAYGLEKKLASLPGAREVRIDLDAGRVAIEVDPARLVRPEQVEAAVRDAGFTPAGFHVRAEGRLGADEGGITLLAGEGMLLSVAAPPEVRERLRARAGEAVALSGSLERAGDRWLLRVVEAPAEDEGGP